MQEEEEGRSSSSAAHEEGHSVELQVREETVSAAGIGLTAEAEERHPTTETHACPEDAEAAVSDGTLQRCLKQLELEEMMAHSAAPDLEQEADLHDRHQPLDSTSLRMLSATVSLCSGPVFPPSQTRHLDEYSH